jgi:hypothetical protein
MAESKADIVKYASLDSWAVNTHLPPHSVLCLLLCCLQLRLQAQKDTTAVLHWQP